MEKTERPRNAADENLCGCDLDFRDADHLADEDLPPATGNVEGDTAGDPRREAARIRREVREQKAVA